MCYSNIGILIVFVVVFCATYILATEYITEKKSKGEILLFRHGLDTKKTPNKNVDEESATQSKELRQKPDSSSDAGSIKTQTAIFHWEDLTYDIKIKGEGRTILDNVDGWVKPGTLTALMVQSGYPYLLFVVLITLRASLVPVKLLFLMFSLVVSPWV